MKKQKILFFLALSFLWSSCVRENKQNVAAPTNKVRADSIFNNPKNARYEYITIGFGQKELPDYTFSKPFVGNLEIIIRELYVPLAFDYEKSKLLSNVTSVSIKKSKCSPNGLEHLPHLKKLNLVQNTYNENSFICTLNKITELSIIEDSIALPLCFCELKQLKKLTVVGVPSIPDCLSSLDSLEYLFIGYIKGLDSLPNSIKNLRHLKKVEFKPYLDTND